MSRILHKLKRHSTRSAVPLAPGRARGLLAATVGLLLVAAVNAAPDVAQAASWSVQPTPTLAGATSSDLSGASCPTATTCVAVGNYVNGSGAKVTLAEAWNGTSWSIQTTPNPAGTTNSTLSSVSCTATTACTAVGGYVNASGVSTTLVEHWSGTVWSIQLSQTPSAGGTLTGVSCIASTCTAVGGTSQNAPLAEQWNGAAWVIQPNATPTAGTLSGISCTDADACYAVGKSGVSALTEQWNGTTWSIQPTPNPIPAGIMLSSNSLSGVSCLTATNCIAVGQWSGWRCNGGTVCNCLKYPCSHLQEPVAERWDGSTWTIMPNRLSIGSLSDVSCATTAACAAVGTISDIYALEDQWTGTSWGYSEIPSNPYADLNAVSCATTTTCTAVGQTAKTSAAPSMTLAVRYS